MKNHIRNVTSEDGKILWAPFLAGEYRRKKTSRFVNKCTSASPLRRGNSPQNSSTPQFKGLPLLSVQTDLKWSREITAFQWQVSLWAEIWQTSFGLIYGAESYYTWVQRKSARARWHIWLQCIIEISNCLFNNLILDHSECLLELVVNINKLNSLFIFCHG